MKVEPKLTHGERGRIHLVRHFWIIGCILQSNMLKQFAVITFDKSAPNTKSHNISIWFAPNLYMSLIIASLARLKISSYKGPFIWFGAFDKLRTNQNVAHLFKLKTGKFTSTFHTYNIAHVINQPRTFINMMCKSFNASKDD